MQMVVSKTKTPKTKTKDPLENEDLLENEDPLKNEDPRENPWNQCIKSWKDNWPGLNQIKSNTILKITQDHKIVNR